MKRAQWIVLFITVLLAGFAAPAWQPPAPGGGKANPANPPLVEKKAPPAKAAPASPTGIIDINHASKADLQALPGIGDAYANAIIRNRPYKNKSQLRSRNVIPEATYNKIKDKIIAKQ
jgi:DNA uptake protein ComE-like DNA-binding protein